MTNRMPKLTVPQITIFTMLCGSTVCAQTLSVRPEGPAHVTTPPAIATAAPPTIDLIVPAGTPLKVALDSEIRVQKVGQPLHGKITEPVYSFDKLLIPAGSEVSGQIAAVDNVSKKQRTMSALDADFSPTRKVHVEFNDLKLPDGRHISLQTVVSAGSQGVLQFVPASTKQPTSKKDEAKNAASRKVNEARQQVHDQWASLKKQIEQPGKMHRIKRLAIDQLPYRPQYMDAGTGFNADLQHPLQFGSEPLTPQMVSAIGAPPPSGSVVHALLVTPLNSATSKKGDAVDAVISQPLVVSDKLFLPEGSHLKGTVLQVQPARRLGRSGQLRIVFHQVVPPNGLEEKIEASLEGVEVAKGEHLSLDAEGGAQVTAPRTRYLTTGIAIALAASSVSHDHDADAAGRSGGEVGKGAANGASGFKLIGTLVSALSHNRAVASSFGFYGAAMSVYSHFLARGRDVVYPKDMSMVVGLGTRETADQSNTEPRTSAQVLPHGPGTE